MLVFNLHHFSDLLRALLHTLGRTWLQMTAWRCCSSPEGYKPLRAFADRRNACLPRFKINKPSPEQPSVCTLERPIAESSIMKNILFFIMLVVIFTYAQPAPSAPYTYNKAYNKSTGQPKPSHNTSPIYVIYSQTQRSTGQVRIGYTAGDAHPTWQLKQMYQKQDYWRKRGFSQPVMIDTGNYVAGSRPLHRAISNKINILSSNYRQKGIKIYDEAHESYIERENALYKLNIENGRIMPIR